MEILKVSNLVSILQEMAGRYAYRANELGMDFGGEYEYEQWMEMKSKLDSAIKRLEDMGNMPVDQISVHFQLCKIRQEQPAFDLPVIEEALDLYYDLQDEELHKIKKQMEDTRFMMKQLKESEESEQYANDQRND